MNKVAEYAAIKIKALTLLLCSVLSHVLIQALPLRNQKFCDLFICCLCKSCTGQWLRKFYKERPH